VEESGGWDESLIKNQDGDFFARVVLNANKILFVEESVGYYRKDNTNSISRQVSRKALQANLKTFETYMELMKDEMDKSEVRRSLALVYSRFFYKIPPSYKDLALETKNRIKNLGFKKPLHTMKMHELFLSCFIAPYHLFRLKQFIKSIMQ